MFCDGTHLLLIYVLEDAFETVEEFLADCGVDAYKIRYVARRNPPVVYHCDRRVLYWETYHMPSLSKPLARKYYTDLFTRIEEAM